jgi:hypothetical protein
MDHRGGRGEYGGRDAGLGGGGSSSNGNGGGRDGGLVTAASDLATAQALTAVKRAATAARGSLGHVPLGGGPGAPAPPAEELATRLAVAAGDLDALRASLSESLAFTVPVPLLAPDVASHLPLFLRTKREPAQEEADAAAEEAGRRMGGGGGGGGSGSSSSAQVHAFNLEAEAVAAGYDERSRGTLARIAEATAGARVGGGAGGRGGGGAG